MSDTAALPDARSDRTGAVTAQRRRAIVDAAIVVFAERGFEGASTREIAEAVGLKQGHLYYYFPAKQDLLFTVIDELHQEFLDGIEEWTHGAEPGDELRAVLAGHVRMVCRDHRQTRIAYESTRFLDPERRQLIVAKRDRYEAAVAELVARHLGPDASLVGLVTRAALGTVNWVYQWYSESGPLDSDELADRLSEMTLALVNGAASHDSQRGQHT
jgi:AcrR family transcriptional regulator